jgi:hypothetical protein
VLYTEGAKPVAALVGLLVTAKPFVVIGGNTSANPASGRQSDAAASRSTTAIPASRRSSSRASQAAVEHVMQSAARLLGLESASSVITD